jgi:hypothetical protein
MQPDDSARDTTHGAATATATHSATTVTATPHMAWPRQQHHMAQQQRPWHRTRHRDHDHNIMQPDNSTHDTTRSAATTTATPHAARQLHLQPQRHATLRRCNYSLINCLFFCYMMQALEIQAAYLCISICQQWLENP